MSQAAALARIFGECRGGQIPRPLGWEEQARPCPVACCGIFDLWSGGTQMELQFSKGKIIGHIVAYVLLFLAGDLLNSLVFDFLNN
jgi:hypothetical protein